MSDNFRIVDPNVCYDCGAPAIGTSLAFGVGWCAEHEKEIKTREGISRYPGRTGGWVVNETDVKALRAKTGWNILDCYRALREVGPDVEKAAQWLEKRSWAVWRSAFTKRDNGPFIPRQET